MSRLLVALFAVLVLGILAIGAKVLRSPRFAAAIAAQVLPLPWRLDPASTEVDKDGRPLFGFGGRRYSRAVPDYYRDERIAKGCPSGGDSVRFVLLAYDGQRYIGGNVSVPPPEWGEARYTRGRIKYHMGRRDVPHTQKLVIIGDSAHENRPILTIGTHGPDAAPLTFDLQIDGGAHMISSDTLKTDVWHAWEMMVNPGQPNGGGSYRLSVNGKVVGTKTGLTFTDGQRQAHGDVSIGYYMNDPVGPKDDFWFELCDVEVAKTPAN